MSDHANKMEWTPAEMESFRKQTSQPQPEPTEALVRTMRTGKRLIDLDPEYRTLEGIGLCLLFDNPVDGSRIAIPAEGQPWPYTGAKWTITNGGDFSKLSIHPSVDVKDSWHGWVTNGEVR